MSEYADNYDDTSYDDSADTGGDQYYEAPAEEPVTDPCMDEPAPVEEPSYSGDPTQVGATESETDYSDSTDTTDTGTDYSQTESAGTETAGTESDYSEPEIDLHRHRRDPDSRLRGRPDRRAHLRAAGRADRPGRR